MELNFFENLNSKLGKERTKEDSENTVTEDVELAQKLDALQEFSVDRIEENIIVLENRENGEIINIEKSKLSFKVQEGDILQYVNGRYILDKEKTKNETEIIKSLMDDLWK